MGLRVRISASTFFPQRHSGKSGGQTQEAARAELTQLEEINHSLELQIEEGFSLQRLSRYAIGQLGMAPPTEVHYVHVPKSDLP